MRELTVLLEAIGRGAEDAAERLLPIIYDELRALAARRLAAERSGQTLQPTALVHEAYLRLVGPGGDPRWEGRAHFFAAASEAMRRILIDRARDRKRLKRGGGRSRRRLDLDSILRDEAPPDDLIDLNEAIGRLEARDPRASALVRLRLFAGLTVAEAADALGLSLRTAERDWSFARAWLFGQLARGDGER